MKPMKAVGTAHSPHSSLNMSWFVDMIAWMPILLALFSMKKQCYALSQPHQSNPMTAPTKVISRKANGSYKLLSLGDTNETHGYEPSMPKSSKQQQARQWTSQVSSVVSSTFLPTVRATDNQMAALSHSNYLKYIFFDNLQDLSTTLRSVLVTRRILQGVGVGRAGATALSATMKFLIRDGTGIVASLLFSSLATVSLRRNIKMWKFFADIMLDVGLTLEIVAPSALSASSWSRSRSFLPLLCFGAVCKAVYGVVSGPSSGVIKLHWALKLLGTEEGIAEITVKRRAQKTVVEGVGLTLAGFTLRWLEVAAVQKKLSIGLYCGLTLIHLLSSRASLNLIALNWLNDWRLNEVVTDFLSSAESSNGLDHVRVMNPVEIANREPLLWLPRTHQYAYCIRMGVSFNQYAETSHQSHSFLRAALQKGTKDTYILTTSKTRDSPQAINIVLFQHCTNRDRAKAFFHDCLLASVYHKWPPTRSENEIDAHEVIRKVEEIAERKMLRLWPMFEKRASDAGWNLDKTECSSEGYEVYVE